MKSIPASAWWTKAARGQQDDLSILLVATSSIPGHVLKHRLRLLAGSAWELRDVSAA